jgi:hypothetical protein
MFKDIYEELAFKFGYLSDLKPDNMKTKFNFLDNMLTDTFVHDFNPKRYMFYIEFMKALKDPATLKKIIYESKLIKSKKEDENKILEEIVKRLNQLFAVTDKNMFANDDVFAEYKKAKIQKEQDEVVKRLTDAMDEYILDDDKALPKKTASKNVIENIEKAFGSTSNIKINGGYGMTGGVGDEKENELKAKKENELKAKKEILEALLNDNEILFKDYDSKIDKLKDDYNTTNLLGEYKDKLKTVLDAPTGDDKIKARKLQDIISEIEDNDMTSIKSLELTKEDRLVFIGITFMIRLLILTVIDWSMTTNFVINFFQAYILYIGLYFVFVLLFVVIVNLTYNLSIYKLYIDKHNLFTSMAGSLYYFYLVPGNMLGSGMRILIHLGLIFFMTIISLFISYNGSYTEDEFNYNYAEKKQIKRQLNNFTLVLWIFTSILAMKL